MPSSSLLGSSSVQPQSHLQASRSFIQQMPKVELHLHLGGAYPLTYLETIATESDRKSLCKYLQANRVGVDYHDWFQIFSVIERVVDSEEKVEEGARLLCHELAHDNVVYVEIRTGLKDYGNGYGAYIDAIQQGIARGMEEVDIEVRLILSFRRHTSFELAEFTVDQAIARKDQGVVGVDVSGDSGIGNIESLLPLLSKARNAGLGVCVHMGECVEEKDQELILNHIHPDRIGHGVHLSDEAHAVIQDNDLAVEACLTSAVLAQMIQKEELHPAIKWWKTGHPVSFSTDDPLIFQVSLTDELWKLTCIESLAEEQLLQLSCDAIQYSFLKEDEKQRLLEKIKN